ncbi:MAG: LysE family translocator [Pseudomonadales bacterium]
MPSADLLLAFLAATAVFAYVPGPSMLYAAAQTLARGRASGLLAALGIHVGGYVHVLAAAAGLAALFHAVPVAYVAVKICGAAYLIWLGAQMLFGSVRESRSGGSSPARSGRRAFLDSVTVEVLNPKTAIFFLAFLPQFTDLHATLPIWAQLLVLGTLVNLIFSTADLACVALAGAAVRTLGRSARAQRVARRLGGSVLVGLGANLALSAR